jgi:cytochrome c-type biogenesis protein CcmH/NrfF
VKSFVAVFTILALVFGLAFAFRSNGDSKPTMNWFENNFVCTTCHEPLVESNSPLAGQMEREARRQIAAGWSKKRIQAYFVAALGPQVLAVPKSHGFDLLAWLLPLAALGCGAIAVGVAARAWYENRDEPGAPGSPAADGPKLAPGLDLRVDQELARFDT